MFIGQELEKGDVETAFLGLFVLYQRWQLVVIAYQDKSLCHPNRSQTYGQRDLRRLVHDAIVEHALIEDWVIDA